MNIQGKYIKYENYVALEEKCAALSDDNDKAMEAMKQANEAVKLAHSKYSKLAAENAALKSALNDILQPDAAVLERNHRVRALDAMETPATDAFLDEVRTQARNELITELESRFNQMTETLPVELRSGAAGAAAFVSAFRKGAAQ
ncbi:hypothetical protein S726_005124 [Salmonella enterica subsp. enterica]|nr:hypothetical protein [Salmonella enterica subsp. enterica]